MYGITGKPYIDLTDYIDTDPLVNLHKDICYGLAQSTSNVTIYGVGLGNVRNKKSFLELAKAYKDSPNEDDRKIFSSLDWNQRADFFKLYEGMYNASRVITLRDMPPDKRIKNYFLKGYAEHTEWTSNAVYFPKLIEWIQSLPFKEIGRIIFFMNEHDCSLQLHRDAPKYFPHNEEFIWFNPSGKKKFYIFDEDKNEKIFVDSKAAFFNSLDWHGGDAIPTLEYSLRVDGKFTDDFKKQIGINHLPHY